mmetsp:Transcript_25609/g.55928  ORF Transcript_25609/g.55928 Transcript_25609/m.55928 type:complete len:276 (-) Transcript_25609:225-1052(-)
MPRGGCEEVKVEGVVQLLEVVAKASHDALQRPCQRDKVDGAKTLPPVLASPLTAYGEGGDLKLQEGRMTAVDTTAPEVVVDGIPDISVVHWQAPLRPCGDHVGIHDVLIRQRPIDALYVAEQRRGLVCQVENHRLAQHSTPHGGIAPEVGPQPGSGSCTIGQGAVDKDEEGVLREPLHRLQVLCQNHSHSQAPRCLADPIFAGNRPICGHDDDLSLSGVSPPGGYHRIREGAQRPPRRCEVQPVRDQIRITDCLSQRSLHIRAFLDLLHRDLEAA